MEAKNLINFLFEAATLKRLKRTGWQILGDNDESIAEHTYMVLMIAFALSENMNVNTEKILIMSLFHDIEEARVGDIYRLSDLYVRADTKKARNDALGNHHKSAIIRRLLDEYEVRKTLEAKIVKDADTLALCIELKQLIEKGNVNAQEWLDTNIDQLILTESKHLGRQLVQANSQDWWKQERRRIKKEQMKIK